MPGPELERWRRPGGTPGGGGRFHYFRPTSLFNTLIMLTLLAGGRGLPASSLKER